MTASSGVAPNKFLAKIASDWRKPNGQFVIQPHEVQDFLLPLPVGKIPGVERITEERMKGIGVATVGDLFAMDHATLEGHFGSYEQRLYELARGTDHVPVVSNRSSESLSAEDTFKRDIPLSKGASFVQKLAEKVGMAPRQNARQARTVVLKLKTKQFSTSERSVTPTEIPSTPEEFTRVALSLCERVDIGPSQLFRLVGVGLSNFQVASISPSPLLVHSG